MSTVMLWSPQAVAGSAAGALVAALWQGALLVAVVALLLQALPGLSAAVRGRLWLGVLGGLVLLPIADLLVPVRSFGTGGAAASVRVGEGWSVALVAAWAVLALARGLQLMASACRVRRIAREARPVEASAEVRALLGGVELCVSDEARRPSVAGWWRPRILLPPVMWAEMTGAELQQVVLHEMEHLRRGDQWTNLLQKAALVAMPLSPAALWVERRLCLERELACDDGVLERSGGRKAYAACLTRMAEQALASSRLGREAVLVLGAWSRKSELVLRVTRLLQGPERALPAGRRRAAVVVVAGAVLLGGAALTEAPRLVQFGPAPEAALAEASPAGTGLADALPVTARRSGASEGGHMVLATAHMPGKTAQALRVAGDGPTLPRTAGQREAKARLRAKEAEAATARPAHVLAAPSLRRVSRRQPKQQGWVILTAFDGAVRARPVPAAQVVNMTLADEDSLTYAAVPVADGWLVVQL